MSSHTNSIIEDAIASGLWRMNSPSIYDKFLCSNFIPSSFAFAVSCSTKS